MKRASTNAQAHRKFDRKSRNFKPITANLFKHPKYLTAIIRFRHTYLCYTEMWCARYNNNSPHHSNLNWMIAFSAFQLSVRINIML